MAIRLTSLILALGAIASCAQAPEADAPEASSAASGTESASAPAAATDEAAVRAAALAFYSGYGGESNSASVSDEKSELTPEFVAAWNQVVGGPEFGLDFDPFCDCQDPFGLAGASVESVTLAGDTATAALQLQWDGGPQTKQLTFKRVGDAWLLDDMTSGEWPSLHRAMAEAEPGSWGVG